MWRCSDYNSTTSFANKSYETRAGAQPTLWDHSHSAIVNFVGFALLFTTDSTAIDGKRHAAFRSDVSGGVEMRGRLEKAIQRVENKEEVRKMMSCVTKGHATFARKRP